MIEKRLFFEKYNIDSVKFDQIKTSWDELVEIYHHFIEQKEDLYAAADLVAKRLQRLDAVNSVKIRIKNPEHLVEKIIRKLIENEDRIINLANYQVEITDLIGIRLLHIFKQQWKSIHDYLMTSCRVNGIPEAYYRQGDDQSVLNSFSENNCIPKIHKFGYRSVHYSILSTPHIVEYKIEVQVRTIFEEGWSEVDHKINYPRPSTVHLLKDLLSILNRISGSADEMSGFAFDLNTYIYQIQNEFLVEKEKSERSTIEIEALEVELKKLVELSTLNEKEKKSLTSKLNELGKKVKELESRPMSLPEELKNQPFLAGIYGAGLALSASQDFDSKNLGSALAAALQPRAVGTVALLPIGYLKCPKCGKEYNGIIYPTCPYHPEQQAIKVRPHK